VVTPAPFRHSLGKNCRFPTESAWKKAVPRLDQARVERVERVVFDGPSRVNDVGVGRRLFEHPQPWRQNASTANRMALHCAVPSVQVKDVPKDVHATLRRRAAAAGQSLQEYLLALLIEEAQTPTLDELLDRAGGRAGGRAGFGAAAAAIRADRDAR
jgi:hypothetical protein